MNLSGRQVSTLACKDYLKIKSSNCTGFISLDKYWNNIIAKNPTYKFTHEKLSKCKFQYRGRELRYSELCAPSWNKMELPQFYDAEAMSVEYCGTVTQEKGYCLRLLQTLDRYLGKARYETIKAATLLDLDFLNADTDTKPYSWQYFQRCYNAENAIYSYYSLYETIVLLIYICAHQNNGRSFVEYSEECRSGVFRRKLRQKDPELFVLISDGTYKANIHPNFAKVCSWCNSFKHRGVLRFDGELMKNQAQTLFIPEPNSGLMPYCSGKSEFVYIDLDNDVIPELVNYHQKIVELAYKVIAHCKVMEREIIKSEERPNEPHEI